MITIIGHPASEPRTFCNLSFILPQDVFKTFSFLLHDKTSIWLEGDFDIPFFVEFERGEG